ncbi:MAG TPA: DNA polymerase III subunit chi [Rhodanobacteraceae bacterium]
MRADFYLIAKPRFRDQPLLLVCALVQKALLAEQPLVILARDFAQAEEIDDLLWSFDEDAFIPHQLAGNEDDAEVPVLIAPPGVETPSRPLAINLREAIPQDAFERVLEVVPAESDARKGSRTRWIDYKRLGAELAKYDM